MKSLKKILVLAAVFFAGVAIFKAGQASGEGSTSARDLQASQVKVKKLKAGTIYKYKDVKIQVRKYTDEDSKGKKYTHEIVEVTPSKAQSLELAKWDTKSGKNQKVVMDYSNQPKE